MTTRTGMIVLAALLVLGGCAAPKDTPELREGLAREIAGLDVLGGAYENARTRATNITYAASISALEEEMGRPATEAEKEQLRGILSAALGAFITPEAWISLASSVYAKHLTAPELRKLAAFYKTPAGSRLLALQGTFAAEMGEAAEALFAENRDSFVKRVDEAVVKAFPDVAAQRVLR